MSNRNIALLPSEEHHLHWNFTVNVLDVACFLLALSIISQTTIMPLLVKRLTDSTFAIGLIPAIASVGYLLPQLLIANYAEGLRRKKRFIQIISGIAGQMVDVLTGVLVGSQALGNRLLAALADRLGHRAILAFGAWTMAAAPLSVLLAASADWLVVTFALVDLSTAAALVSSLNIILEFCAAEDRPTYIGLTNTLLAPLIGAGLAAAIGYQGVFAAASVLAWAGSLLMAGWVREPRSTAAITPSAA